MKRTAHPPLSSAGQETLASYEDWLREREDLASASIRNYVSDLCHFIAWYEMEREAAVHGDISFTVQGVTTPSLTRYRSYLQIVGRQKPASVNRSLISLKRYFGWAFQRRLIIYDPSTAVKLVGTRGERSSSSGRSRRTGARRNCDESRESPGPRPHCALVAHRIADERDLPAPT